MKTLVIFAALLGSLLATDNIDINNQGNVGENVHQTVNINNQDHVANINNLNGWNSWNSICDYGRGVFATRLYGKQMCVVTKMDNAVFPSLEVLQQKPVQTTTHFFKYNVNEVPIANIGIYGVHIEALCGGIPSYTAEVSKGDKHHHSDCDPKSIITILGITFCF
ncbi:gastrokine-1-like [Anomaloglossus baeobatrachus]|uniref:gastrokine-1-like n=1 Tax=Anomaloglossus baeobatrachus TaxID=238106 RepID=UPI003F501BB3